MVILTRRPPYIKQSEIHTTVNPSRCSLCCAALISQLQSLSCAWLHDELGHLSVTGACRQLPLGTSDYASCLALPLSKKATRTFPVNVLHGQSGFLARK